MDKNATTIRPAQIQDLNSVYALICSLEDIKFDLNIFRKIYEQNLANNHIFYFIAENDHKNCIGFISLHVQLLLHHCSTVAEIQELMIDESYRSKGIGKLLVQTAENKARSLYCDSFEVTAQVKRIRTHEFYERLGFKQSHLKFTKALWIDRKCAYIAS